MKERNGEFLVRCASHRSREKVFRLIGRKAQAYVSFRRNTGTVGTYAVSAAELAKIRGSGIAGVTQSKWTDDLFKAWC